MPPKKKKETDKKGDKDVPADKMQTELQALEVAKQSLDVSVALLADKCGQARAENARLMEHAEALRTRYAASCHDFDDILRHRTMEKARAEAGVHQLQRMIDDLQSSAATAASEVTQLQDTTAAQAARLQDAAAMLTDKDAMEATLRQQHALLEQQASELTALKGQLDARDATLAASRQQVADLTLRAAGATALKVVLNDLWLLQTRHLRLAGAAPTDRAGNTLTSLGGGKLLVLCGGEGAAGSDTSVLNLDTLNWEQAEGARFAQPLASHSVTQASRNRLLAFGGLRGAAPTAELLSFHSDSMRWTPQPVKGTAGPPPRTGHAAAAIRDRLYIFGGVAEDGALLNDLWVFDYQEYNQWSEVTCYGQMPCPRRGASLVATEDGRRLYVFGGHDGSALLAEVHYLDSERSMWSVVTPSGVAPEPREGHVASLLCGKYMLVAGGCGQGGPRPAAAAAATAFSLAAAAAGVGGSPSSSASPRVAGASGRDSLSSAGGVGPVGHGGGGPRSSRVGADGGGLGSARGAHSNAAGGATAAAGAGRKRLSDVHVLDLFTGPTWGCLLQEAGWGGSAALMKQQASYIALAGQKLLLLKPNVHETLDEMVVAELTPPGDIEALRAAHSQQAAVVERLEIDEDATCTTNTIEVSWRPPSKNSERITTFKLMAATSTGVVREVYQGRGTCTRTAGLRPNAEYVFCVKALYDDGTFLWSDSRAFCTKA